MNKRLNIFITNEEKRQLENIKYKYRLSFSTIVKILSEIYESVAQKVINGERLIKGGNKTSIKVPAESEKPYYYYENAVHMFCGKMLKEYYKQFTKNKKDHEKVWSNLQNMIYNKFEQTKDLYFDYNTYIRYKSAFENQQKGA